jgi:hypothetical protein
VNLNASKKSGTTTKRTSWLLRSSSLAVADAKKVFQLPTGPQKNKPFFTLLVFISLTKPFAANSALLALSL